MRSLSSALLLLSLIFLLSSPAIAKSGATSFCKCICGSESQIIALNPPDAEETARSLSLLRRVFEARDADDDDKEKEKQQDEGGEKKEGEDKSPDDKGGADDSKTRQKTCSDCNRAFCLSYDLPKCKTLPEEEVYTQCFRTFERDSSKDQAVVLLFIAATFGLLGWALVRPCIRRFPRNARDRASYAPVRGEGN